jgi:formamidopyrimidine-DNA glycosylase
LGSDDGKVFEVCGKGHVGKNLNMPELPEIETVKLQLEKVLVGKTLEQVEVINQKSWQGNPKGVEGKKIVGIRRMAKVLLIDLEGEMTMAFHFKMSGQLVFENSKFKSAIADKSTNDKSNSKFEIQNRIAGGHPTKDFMGELPSSHTRVIFKFNTGTMYFNDQRKFGWVKVDSTLNINNLSFLNKLGPEPFNMNKEEFRETFNKLKKPIKLALMDQEKLAGVGNIYANDACWEAGIDPRTRSDQIPNYKLEKLHAAVIKVLNEGIKYGGATAADAKYMNLHGLGGHYQDYFKVYDREGKDCLRHDGGKIEKVSMGGRGTYFCPVCQK